MAEAQVARTLDVSPDALWPCVRAFGDVPWIPGGSHAEIRGEGVGQLRIFERPHGQIHEQLSSLDDRTRTLTYTIPQGMPFPVTDYEAQMRVDDDAGKGRLSWSCRFEPVGADAEAIAKTLQSRFSALMDRLEARLKDSDRVEAPDVERPAGRGDGRR
jgi:hypothetical protein